MYTLTTLLTAMNLTDFHDSSLLKLDIGGPFVEDIVDHQTEEYIVVQISQSEDAGSRRRRQQQVMVFKFLGCVLPLVFPSPLCKLSGCAFPCCEVCQCQH